MNLSRVSKTMSWMLRHCQEPRYIDLKGGRRFEKEIP